MSNSFLIEGLDAYINKSIDLAIKKGTDTINALILGEILVSKNPYLLRLENFTLPVSEIVEILLKESLREYNKIIFEEFALNLAIFVCTKVYGGTKSSAEGIDLEFEKDGIRYMVSIKSGPNWGNSGQIKKMNDNFKKAKRIIGTNSSKINITAINGCCYGKDNKPDKGDYLKLCGQSFWEFISGDDNFFIKIIEPLSFEAKAKNDSYLQSYAQMLNKFTLEFTIDFCDDGIINWERIVRFNSETKK